MKTGIDGMRARKTGSQNKSGREQPKGRRNDDEKLKWNSNTGIFIAVRKLDALADDDNEGNQIKAHSFAQMFMPNSVVICFLTINTTNQIESEKR